MSSSREKRVFGASGLDGATARYGALLAALFAAAGILPFALVHIDDVDGAVYQVVARHVAEDGRLFHLRFLPDFWPRFFEHPPLYFWIQAAVIRLGSESLLPWLGAAVGICTAVVTYLIGRRLIGVRAALLGTFMLAATELFFRYQARPRLDPPLSLAFTLSVALLVVSRGRVAWLAAGGLAAGLGALIKGPPALGAPISAALVLMVTGRWEDLRRPRVWIVAAVAALLPPVVFLIVDRLALGGAWWQGYVRDQFLASWSGGRVEGATSPVFLPRAIVGRFWPGLPFLAWALFDGVRSPRSPRSRTVFGLCTWAAVIVGGYMTAARAYTSYVEPALMPLALAAGVGLESLLLRLFGEAGPRRAVQVAAVTGFIALGLVPLWPAGWLAPPCVFGDLPARAALLAPAGTPLRMAALPQRDFMQVRALAGWLAQHSGRDVVVSPEAKALVGLFETPGDAVLEGWTPVERNGAWVLAVPQ
jgi:4-amino-4-deoxy-L-arabinose transferase-like glycosyltransferase